MPKLSLIVLALLTLISACDSTERSKAAPVERTEAVLPSAHVRGAESGSFSLYAKGPEGTTTSLGQIFISPEGHPYLIKIGFLCRPAFGPNNASDITVKLRISTWESDRPATLSAWESEPTLMSAQFQGGWLSFDIPHLKLIPNKKYIAWLSMAGLQNEAAANFGVVSMGPRTTAQQPRPKEPYQPNSWEVAYPEGTRAFWRHNNPDGTVDNMTQSPWMTEGNGYNLHFKMGFQNLGS